MFEALLRAGDAELRGRKKWLVDLLAGVAAQVFR